MARKSVGSGAKGTRGAGLAWNLYMALARAVASSGIFTVRLGRRSLGEYLDRLLTTVLVGASRALYPWRHRPLMNALRSIVPPAPVYRLALHSYEPETTRLFRQLLRPGMAVVDVGAEIGYYTVLAAMEVGAAGHVYAFEPDPQSLPILRQNVHLGGYEDVVTIVPVAVTSGRGQAELFLGQSRGVTSMFPTRDRTEATGHGEKQSITVETTSLDAYFADLSWPRVDLMKMDIDGAETLALPGMAELAQRNPHLKLIIEFCPQHIRDAGGTPAGFFAALEEVGFTQVRLTSDGLKPVRWSHDLPWLVALAQRNTVNLLCQRGED